MAFSLQAYVDLLTTLKKSGYGFGPVRAYFEGYEPPFVFLRHDVDRLPRRARVMAEAEASLDVRATYYFRCTAKGRFPAQQIQDIAELGHEIGYHYETLSRHQGDSKSAFLAFREELAALRRLAEIQTVAAHGSPLSTYANMDFTRDLDLDKMDLLGEPGTDFDFQKVLYITDTGGVFGSPHNRRDRVAGKNLSTPTPPRVLAGQLTPEHEPLVLLSTHPERWPRGKLGLVQARMLDSAANLVKAVAQRLGSFS